MSDNKLAALAVVAVIMVILAIVQSRIPSGPVESETPGYLIPGLNVDRIGSIVIGKGDNIVTLKRTAGHFVVANKDNYPAKVSEINNLLTKCQEIRWLQMITDNPKNHEDLEVSEQNARSIVRFLTPEPNSTVLAGIVAGKTKDSLTGGTGAYVRLLSSDKKSSDKVYLAHSIPWFSSQVLDYIDKGLISCKFEDIESVTVSSSEGQYTLKAKQDSKEIMLENIPEGKKLKVSDAKSIFTALADMRIEDVMKKTSGLLFGRKFICRLKNSTVYTIDIAQKNGKTYIICDAEFTDNVERPTKDETEEQLKEKEAQLIAWEKATEFADKHKGWTYLITDLKAKNLSKSLSDLLEDDDNPKDTEIPAEPNSTGIDELLESLNLEEPDAVKTEQ